MRKKIATIALRLAVTGFSLAFLYYIGRGKFLAAFDYLENLNPLPLFVVIAFFLVSLVLVSFRLQLILSIQGVSLPFGRLYYLWVISHFFNLFLPSAVGGDIVKAYYIYKDTGKKMASATSVLIDRFFGLMSTISIGMIAFLIAREHVQNPRVGQTLFWLACVAIGGVLFLISKRFSRPLESFIIRLVPREFRERASKLFAAINLYRTRKKDFFVSYGISIGAQSLFVVLVYSLGQSLRINAPISIYFLFMPIVLVISMIPSLGGLGVREAGMVYLFKTYMPVDQAVALSIMFAFFIYGIGMASGILYGIRGGGPIVEIEKIEAA